MRKEKRTEVKKKDEKVRRPIEELKRYRRGEEKTKNLKLDEESKVSKRGEGRRIDRRSRAVIPEAGNERREDGREGKKP